MTIVRSFNELLAIGIDTNLFVLKTFQGTEYLEFTSDAMDIGMVPAAQKVIEELNKLDNLKTSLGKVCDNWVELLFDSTNPYYKASSFELICKPGIVA